MVIRVMIVCALIVAAALPCVAENTILAKGTVVDADGNPVAGVKVFAVMVKSRAGYTSSIKAGVVSDSDGSFEFPALKVPEGFTSLSLIAFEPDTYLGWSCHPLGVTWTSRSAPVLREGVKVVVSRPGAVEGRVVDENGNPVAGATVRHSTFRPKVEEDFSLQYVPPGYIEGVVKLNPALTDSDGRFRLTSVPEHLTVRPQVSSAGYAMKPLRYDVPLDLDNIVMIPGGSLTGRLVDEHGKGVGGALVTVRGQNEVSGWGKAVTADDGSYTIDGLPPDEYRTLFYYAREDHITLVRPGVRVVAHETTSLDDTVSPRGATVTGRVIDQDTGEPVAGARVHAGSDSFYGGTGKTDEHGVYELTVLPGTVRINYSGGNPHYMRDFRSIPKPVTVSKDGLKGWDIELKKAEVGHGTVVDKNGEPVGGAVVSIGHFGRGTNAVTDEKGSFSISLPPESAGGG